MKTWKVNNQWTDSYIKCMSWFTSATAMISSRQLWNCCLCDVSAYTCKYWSFTVLSNPSVQQGQGTINPTIKDQSTNLILCIIRHTCGRQSNKNLSVKYWLDIVAIIDGMNNNFYCAQRINLNTSYVTVYLLQWCVRCIVYILLDMAIKRLHSSVNNLNIFTEKLRFVYLSSLHFNNILITV